MPASASSSIAAVADRVGRAECTVSVVRKVASLTPVVGAGKTQISGQGRRPAP